MGADSAAIPSPTPATRAAAAEVATRVATETGPDGDVTRGMQIGGLAARAGVDRFALERWIERETWLGAHTAPESVDRDVGLARVLHAWAQRDAQTLLDALEGVTRHPAGGVDDRSRRHRRAAYGIGSNAVLSGLFDAATDKRVTGAAGHPRDYYDADPGGVRQAEAFASLVSVAGSGEIGRQLLERFAPEMYRSLRERLEKP